MNSLEALFQIYLLSRMDKKQKWIELPNSTPEKLRPNIELGIPCMLVTEHMAGQAIIDANADIIYEQGQVSILLKPSSQEL